MLFLALGFLTGDLLFQQLSRFPGAGLFCAILAAAVVCAWFRKWLWLGFFAGWLWSGSYAYLQLKQTSLAPRFEGEIISVQGVIDSVPVSDDRRARFDFFLTGASLGLPAKLRLNWYHPSVDLRAGQHWSFKIKLKSVHGLLNPGGFDYERWLFTQGIGATGYIRDPEQAKLIKQDRFWQNPNVVRQLIADRLSSVTHLSYPGFLQALTIGKTDRISPDQWRVLRKTGTVHLMVISGSHISLVAGLVFAILLQLWLRFGAWNISPQKVAAIASGMIGAVYALLAGFSIPVQRALLMLTVALTGIATQRHIRIMQLLAIAVLLILLWDPLAVLAEGFWLSFFAVLLIFYSLSGRLGGARYWSSALKIHGVTALGLAPMLAVFFQQISLIAPLANLVAVPVITLLIVPMALIAVLLLFCCQELGIWLFSALDFSLALLYRFLTFLSEWRYSALTGIAAPPLAICLAGLGFLVLLMPKGLPGRSLAWLMCLPLFLNSPSKPMPGELKLTLLDVGQGLSAVIQTAEHVLIYDTGIKFSESADSGQSVLLPFLANQGLTRVNALVVSHGDNDHIGGAASLLAEFSPSRLYTSVPERLPGYPARRCAQGQKWVWDAVEFVMLGPALNEFRSENDNSCVLKITGKGGSVLLPGDIEKTAEQWLVRTYSDALKAAILVAPHHGSKTSSTEAFLQRVNPELIIIPAGFRNQFHFPHGAVLERYRKHHKPWLTVSEQGAITINITGQQLGIRSYRVNKGKYWHKQYSSATL